MVELSLSLSCFAVGIFLFVRGLDVADYNAEEWGKEALNRNYRARYKDNSPMVESLGCLMLGLFFLIIWIASN